LVNGFAGGSAESSFSFFAAHFFLSGLNLALQRMTVFNLGRRETAWSEGRLGEFGDPQSIGCPSGHLLMASG